MNSTGWKNRWKKRWDLTTSPKFIFALIKPYDDEGKLCKLYVKKLEKVYGFKYDYNRVNTDDEDVEENLWERLFFH